MGYSIPGKTPKNTPEITSPFHKIFRTMKISMPTIDEAPKLGIDQRLLLEATVRSNGQLQERMRGPGCCNCEHRESVGGRPYRTIGRPDVSKNTKKHKRVTFRCGFVQDRLPSTGVPKDPAHAASTAVTLASAPTEANPQALPRLTGKSAFPSCLQ